jgi:hypothetical protein
VTSPSFPMRRLLLLPAVALVLLGGPVLAMEDPGTPPAAYSEVPAAPAGETVQAGWTSAPTPVDANLVGVKWDGDPEAAFTVEVQSPDGTWAKPTPIEGGNEADEGTQDATAAAAHPGTTSEPVWVGENVTNVRVSLTSGEAADVKVAAVDSTPEADVPAGSAAALGDIIPHIDGPSRYAFAAALFGVALLLGAMALGWTPWRSRRLMRMLPLAAVAILLAACVPPAPTIPDGTVQPGIYSRETWGARPYGNAGCSATPDIAPALKFAVVHHTVNSNDYSSSQVASMIRGIQSYHMDANGYCDIAYNFIVDKFGGIFEGRAGGIANPVIGGHTGGFNTGSVGVALLGTYTSVQPSDAEWNSLVHLLRWRLSVGHVNANAPFTTTVASSPCNCQRWAPGTVVTIPVSVVGHRDLDFTECPGDAFWPRLGALRDQVQAGTVFPPPPPPTTTTT